MENPFWLVAALAAAEVVTLLLWRVRWTRSAGFVAAVPVLLAAAVLLLAWLVVTDREQIADAYDAIAADVVAGRTEVLAGYLDEDVHVDLDAGYGLDTLDKAEAIAQGRRHIREVKLREIKLSQMEITVTDGQAQTKLTTTILSDWPETGGAPFVVAWDVAWVKRSDGWRIHRAAASPGRPAFEGGP